MILKHGDYIREDRFDADVVIVGTGAGGACVGAELAEAGFEVTFVEEGSYFPTSSFSPHMEASMRRLYRDAGGTVILGKAPIPYAEGRCVGGSTVLNGGMTWRTPERVHTRWEKEVAPELGLRALEPLYDAVEASIHAAPQMPESVGDDNRIMVQGARKMGWRVDVNKRNQVQCVGSNSCIMGCPTGAKQSTLVSLLPRASARGARVLTEIRIEELIIERGRCVGVAGRAVDPRTRRRDRRVEVRAPVVVLACGAVHTPHLLQRYKVGRPSGRLGQNFTCHPNGKVLAVYPFDVKGWQGVSQYAKIMEFFDDGIMLAENFVPPGVLGAHLPCHGAAAWELMQRYNQMVASGFLLEDDTTGSVRRGPFDTPLPRYDMSPRDHQRFLRAATLLAEMHFAMGAERVYLPFSNLHEARSVDDLKRIDPRTQRVEHLELFTVHMMGTVSMGARPEASVADLRGELWDLPGCYVADASLLPTAIGVNPQVTIMVLALKVARAIAEAGRMRRAA